MSPGISTQLAFADEAATINRVLPISSSFFTTLFSLRQTDRGTPAVTEKVNVSASVGAFPLSFRPPAGLVTLRQRFVRRCQKGLRELYRERAIAYAPARAAERDPALPLQ